MLLTSSFHKLLYHLVIYHYAYPSAILFPHTTLILLQILTTRFLYAGA